MSLSQPGHSEHRPVLPLPSLRLPFSNTRLQNSVSTVSCQNFAYSHFTTVAVVKINIFIAFVNQTVHYITR